MTALVYFSCHFLLTAKCCELTCLLGSSGVIYSFFFFSLWRDNSKDEKRFFFFFFLDTEVRKSSLHFLPHSCLTFSVGKCMLCAHNWTEISELEVDPDL